MHPGATPFRIIRRNGYKCEPGSFFRKSLIPSAYAIRSRTAHARYLAAKSAFAPFGLIVSDERKSGCEYPPFTGKSQIAALHVVQCDIFPLADLANMFG